MLSRRNRDLPPQKGEPAPFAARAKDLGAWQNSVADAAGVGAGFWISYLFALFYFAIAALAVTHRDLLLETPVKLPFLNVELPLETFSILGPLVILFVHNYVLLHFVTLADRISCFNAELRAQISSDLAKDSHRRQLSPNIVVQYLAGPRELQTQAIRILLWLVIWISLVAGPIVLLIVFQLQFLPYHSALITCSQRTFVSIDLALLWFLWPRIARCRRAARLRLLVIILPALLMVTIATFPGERLEANARRVPSWTTLHELLFAGQVNYVTGKPQSVLSNVLVLPNFEVGGHPSFDANGAIIPISSHPLSLRGRSLEGVVLAGAHLRNADFTGASLERANFVGADLREAKFECEKIGATGAWLGYFSVGFKGKDTVCAQLQDAIFASAKLQGASLSGAQLQGATFLGAKLQGSNLNYAQLQGSVLFGAPSLQGASLVGAQLQGAWLDGAQLQGANLDQAELEGAALEGAQLQGASLVGTQLQGVYLWGARLDGALLRRDYVWRTGRPSNATGAFIDAPVPEPKYSGVDCPNLCEWSGTSYAALKSLIENSVRSGDRDKALQQIAILERPPYVADASSAKAWTDFAEQSARSPSSYFSALEKTLKEIGCAADGAPYVISGLIRPVFHNVQLDYRFDYISQEAEVAAAFLDERCPGARGLSEENKAKLREIRDRGLSAPTGPGNVVR
jgi:uncharacterized protein YjbI with pentapeptide repeats